MKSAVVRTKFLEFYHERGHVVIPSAPLVPENDPTTLFVSSGMQPLIPYLLGQPHPVGKRLVNSQRTVRLQDIDEVGDNRHTTFFEMLGNWSLGDYFKKEQQGWIWEFLIKELYLYPEKLYFSVFEGNDSIPRDEEAEHNWKSLGVSQSHIYYYGVNKNWWARSSYEDMPVGEPGGPSSEIFYDFGTPHDKKYGKDCHPNCDCGRFLEIGNNVFMTYQKTMQGFDPLVKKNIDFGGGLERLVAATENSPDVFQTDLFIPLYQKIEELTGKKYGEDVQETRAMRIICDHVKAAVMMSADGVLPSNKTQGYILRRLIRRALLYGRRLRLMSDFTYIGNLVPGVEEIYQESYPGVASILQDEAVRFGKSLERGLAEIEKVKTLDGKIAFTLYESYGFPWEMIEEIAREKGQQVNRQEFEEEFKKHQELSRTAAKGMFAGGLADHSEETTKLHTATHLLHQALRTILGEHVSQKGSNITVERLRFDFSHPTKIPREGKEGLEAIEELVNEKIQENLPVSFAVMDKDEAIKSGAMAFFGERYGDKVKVYSIGSFSKEICGGPHVSFTGTLGHLTIVKEEALGSGLRRIYATLQ